MAAYGSGRTGNIRGETRRNKSRGPSAKLSRLGIFVVMTGTLFYGVLSLVPAQYRSVSEVSLQKQGGLSKQLVARQMQFLGSRKMIEGFARTQKLAKDPDYNGLLKRRSPLQKAAVLLGLVADPAKSSKKNRVNRAFRKKLKITRGRTPHTIKIAVRSSSPAKSALLANLYAKAYIAELDKQVGPVQKREANMSLSRKVEDLRGKIKAQTLELEKLREELNDSPEINPSRDNPVSGKAESGLPVKLSSQQLAELTARHILAKADLAQIEARAKLVHEMLESNGEIYSTSTVLNSGHVQTMLQKQARLERKISDLSVALLPSHPQMKRLNRELTGLKKQIRSEAQKAVANLDNEVVISAARERSLKESLAQQYGYQSGNAKKANSAKKTSQSHVGGGARNNPRVIEIDNLRSLLATNRLKLDVAQRELAQAAKIGGAYRSGAINARLVVRAVAVNDPVFPRKKPMTFIGMVAAFCLGFVYLVLGAKNPSASRRKTITSSYRSEHAEATNPSRSKSTGLGVQPART